MDVNSLEVAIFNGSSSFEREILEFQNCTEADLKYHPSSEEFFEALGTPAWIIMGLASTALCSITLMYIINVIYVCRKVQSQYVFSTNVALSVYIGISLCIYLQIFVPRANLILDIASNLWLIYCIFHFFKLTIKYYGGQQNMVNCLDGSILPWRNPPFCCLPCFWPCLPKTNVHKGQVKFLAILVLQHPIFQAFTAVVAVTMYVEGWVLPGGNTVSDPYFYINIATIISFLFALWAFIVLMKCSMKPLSDFSYIGKGMSLQFCVFFVRFQNFIFTLILMPAGVFPCIKPISPGVYANLILSCLVLGQLVALSVSASYFYRISVSDKKSAKPTDDGSNNNVTCNLL